MNVGIFYGVDSTKDSDNIIWGKYFIVANFVINIVINIINFDSTDNIGNYKAFLNSEIIITHN